VVEDAADKLPSLADELGKAAPELQCEGGGLRLTMAWGALLRDALVHLFRNSLDHGLEPRDERVAAGKSPRGQLSVWAEARDQAVVIRVSDDGRGLALDRLRDKAEGQPCSEDELAELIFAFGVSTAASVSTISGRGVGMDAVRSDLRRHGGDASVEFTGPRRDGHRPFALVLKLPVAALVAPLRLSRSDEAALASA
jgi:two-component system chemotaxis sensor kinase CheA